MRLRPSSDHSQRTLRTAFITAVVILGAFAIAFMQRSSSTPVFRGQLTNIGTKAGRTVTSMTFQNGEISEGISVDHLNVVLVPDLADISTGTPLSTAITSGKRVFGYKYTSGDGAAEIAAKLKADNGEPLSYSELFPGQFFASDEERGTGTGTFIAQFEEQKNISFLSLSAVMLERNARYVLVTTDAETSLTVRGLSSVCGDGKVNGSQEECDDGNENPNDRCTNSCKNNLMWSSVLFGGTRDEVNRLCSELIDQGYRGWRLPLATELEQKFGDNQEQAPINPWAPRSINGYSGVLWSNSSVPPVNQRNAYAVYNLSTGLTQPEAENQYITAVCVDGSTPYHDCTDSDLSAYQIENRHVNDYFHQSLFTKGSVHFSVGQENNDVVDTCVDAGTVEEHWCAAGDKYSGQYFCPYGFGCLDGACNETLPPGQQQIAAPTKIVSATLVEGSQYVEDGHLQSDQWLHVHYTNKADDCAGLYNDNGVLLSADRANTLPVACVDSTEKSFFLPHSEGDIYLRESDWTQPIVEGDIVKLCFGFGYCGSTAEVSLAECDNGNLRCTGGLIPTCNDLLYSTPSCSFDGPRCCNAAGACQESLSCQ